MFCLQLLAPSLAKYGIEPAKDLLSEDELAKKTTALIDEYANVGDLTVKPLDILMYMNSRRACMYLC